MSQPSVVDASVVIVSWNTRRLTSDCLASLPAAAGPLRWEAWVVDNASTDGSPEAIRTEFPDVHLIANAVNLGFAAANNLAIRASRGRYVLLLNSDTVMAPGSLAALVQFAEARPALGVAGPMLLNPDGSFQSGPIPFPSLWTEGLSTTGLGKRLRFAGYPSRGPEVSGLAQRTDYVSGACMLARRQAVDEVGLLDEGYFMYSEEPDWCWRMRQRGWETWYTPDARVTHFGGQSTHQVRDPMYIALHRSKVRFFRQHRGSWRARCLVAMFMATSGARTLLRTLLGRRPRGVRLTRADLWPTNV